MPLYELSVSSRIYVQSNPRVFFSSQPHTKISYSVKKKKEKQEKKNKKKKKMVEESARGASGREGATGIARGELAQATGKNSVSSLLSVCRGRRSLQCEIHTSEFRASSSWFCCIQVSECKQKRRTDYNCCRRHGWIISEYTNNKVS